MAEVTERQRDQQRRAHRARSRALRALAREYPERYRELYESEALAEGVMPLSARERALAGVQADREVPG